MSGSLPSQTIRLFNRLNMACISRSTYFRHQSNYVIPVVVRSWEDEQAAVINSVTQLDGGLCLAGDSRSDSPGHSAKYGGYNTLEQRINKVIDRCFGYLCGLLLNLVKIQSVLPQCFYCALLIIIY